MKLILCIVVFLIILVLLRKPVQEKGKIVVKKSSIAGRGVFANKDIKKDEVIEVCPTIKFNTDSISDSSELMNYYFDTSSDKTGILLLGYGSLYNHSSNNNADYYVNDSESNEDTFIIISKRKIKKGEEITINYSDDWFESRGITEK